MSQKFFSLANILCNWTNRPRQHHCSFVLWWWWITQCTFIQSNVFKKSHNKNLKNTIPFLLISGVQVSTRVWTSKASLQSPECWRQFSGPKTNRHLTLLGRTAEGPSWRRLPVSGSKSESDKKRKHPAEMGEPALFGVQGEQAGLSLHTSLCLKDLPHGRLWSEWLKPQQKFKLCPVSQGVLSKY